MKMIGSYHSTMICKPAVTLTNLIRGNAFVDVRELLLAVSGQPLHQSRGDRPHSAENQEQRPGRQEPRVLHGEGGEGWAENVSEVLTGHRLAVELLDKLAVMTMIRTTTTTMMMMTTTMTTLVMMTKSMMTMTTVVMMTMTTRMRIIPTMTMLMATTMMTMTKTMMMMPTTAITMETTMIMMTTTLMMTIMIMMTTKTMMKTMVMMVMVLIVGDEWSGMCSHVLRIFRFASVTSGKMSWM